MSVLLYVVGAIAVMVGVGMVAFGIPINEFSFGNTLIGAGITAATGGLIILSLGVVAGQLHRLAESLAARPLTRPARPAEAPELQPESQPVPAAGAPPRMPAPARPKADLPSREVTEPRMTMPGFPGPSEEQTAPSFAPSLRNPEAPPLAVDDDVSLSPDTPRAGARPAVPPSFNGGPSEPPFQPTWRGPPREVPPPNFDTMWPAEPRPSRGSSDQPPPPPRPDSAAREHGVPPPASREPAQTPPGMESLPTPPPRAVAILKSGVVDGMGYTLYVDGSIEAELPQGTLRFASIEELRAHLEKNN